MSRVAFTTARQALLGPYHVFSLVTRAKSFGGNPILGSPWLNERGLHTLRVRLAHRIAASRRQRLAHVISAEDRLAFERDGFVVRENFLPAAAFQELLSQISAYRGRVRQIAQGTTINRKFAVGPDLLAAIPALRPLLASADWRGLIHYVGSRAAEPAVFIQTIMQNASAGPSDPETVLHADTFHPTVKAWLFLMDIAADGGPFVYVPGSHRLTPARLAWQHETSMTASRADIRQTREGSFRVAERDLARLGLPAPRRFAVSANTLIVADTFGFHARGRSSRPSLRAEIFALGPRSPFTPWRGFTRIEGMMRSILNLLAARFGQPESIRQIRVPPSMGAKFSDRRDCPPENPQ
jgi:hypothetical protein